ncbi:hypothetical protein HQ945_18680 [Phyllobacterium sp. BT25]|jgi:hypothetical protein|uniref:Rap1a immunity protein domain-containing protein n=1 Tax=Phyllobacterium pellucidum TaxID=2740464 RepID=A0A849VTH5_9HYPH|nr:hypothetical protein [Phyllobacterium pellucidum]NTS33282.1 hypothetical protein [Phyllobacterium pellucidum]
MKLALLLVLLSVSPVNAMSAAELLKADKGFASGYIFGAIEYQIAVACDDDVSVRRQEIRKCLVDGKFMSQQLYGTVISFIKIHPEQTSAVGAIVHAVDEICPRSGR